MQYVSNEYTHYTYDAFGDILSEKQPTFKNWFTYVGKYGVIQDEQDRYYMRARHYIPSIGRFIGEDPVWSTNLFPYVNNNPINGIDPSGNVLETPWDAANVAMDLTSMGLNIADGNYGGAALDAAGLLYDGIATIVPFLPGGAGAVIKVARAGKKIRNGAEGFSSFRALKRFAGKAGQGKAWHHIVEQNNSNIAKFGSEQIHNLQNVVKIPHGKGSMHSKVTGFYNSLMPGSNIIWRDYVKTLSYREQYEFGIKILKRYGWR